MSQFYPMREIPDVSIEQCRSNALIKRAQQLRWMGLEEEPHGKQRARREVVSEIGGVLTMADNTD
jgi:hypothetical protein